jgi:flagella basal body P-ring formation protein FlgA
MTSMVAFLLALLAVPESAPAAREILPREVSESLTHALAIPGARIVPITWSAPANCRIQNASVAHAIDGSGRVAVKFSGRGCSGWGWVHLEVWAETAVTTRAVRVGEVLDSSFAMIDQEVRPGHMPFVPPDGTVAVRVLPAGTAICAADVSTSAVVAGDPVKIVVAAGAVAIETQGRRVACARSRTCAVLSTGKHVEGRMDDSGRLIVEVPR